MDLQELTALFQNESLGAMPNGGSQDPSWSHMLAMLQAEMQGLPYFAPTNMNGNYEIQRVQGMLDMMGEFYGTDQGQTGQDYQALVQAWRSYTTGTGTANAVQTALSQLQNDPPPNLPDSVGSMQQAILYLQYHLENTNQGSTNLQGYLDGAASTLCFLINESPLYDSNANFVQTANPALTNDIQFYADYMNTPQATHYLNKLVSDLGAAAAALQPSSTNAPVPSSPGTNSPTSPWTDILSELAAECGLAQTSAGVKSKMQGIIDAMALFWESAGGSFSTDMQKLSQDFAKGNMSAVAADIAQLQRDGVPTLTATQAKSAMAGLLNKMKSAMDGQDLSKVITDPGYLEGLGLVGTLFVNGLGCFSSQTIQDINTEIGTNMPSFTIWSGDSQYAETALNYNDAQIEKALQDLNQ